MKLCPSCFSEFRDEAVECDACKVSLVSEVEGVKLKAARPSEKPDGAGLVPVARTTDPFEAEAFVAACKEAGLDAFSRDRRRSAVDVLVTSGRGSFWDIMVPADRLDEAHRAIEARRRELLEEADSAARAAEEEEAATEGHVVVGETESESQAGKWVLQLKGAGIEAVLRAREDVELDPADQGEPPVTVVLVPEAQADKARELLRGM